MWPMVKIRIYILKERSKSFQKSLGTSNSDQMVQSYSQSRVEGGVLRVFPVLKGFFSVDSPSTFRDVSHLRVLISRRFRSLRTEITAIRRSTHTCAALSTPSWCSTSSSLWRTSWSAAFSRSSTWTRALLWLPLPAVWLGELLPLLGLHYYH